MSVPSPSKGLLPNSGYSAMTNAQRRVSEARKIAKRKKDKEDRESRKPLEKWPWS